MITPKNTHPSALALSGRASGTLNGKLTDDNCNLVVDSGTDWAIARLSGAGSAIGWLAIGAGTTAPVVGDTALEAELARVAVDVSGGTPTGSDLDFSATFGPGIGAGSITEAGLFDAEAGGNLIARVTFGVITKGVGDTLVRNWTLSLANL